jgi:hypothetical protein
MDDVELLLRSKDYVPSVFCETDVAASSSSKTLAPSCPPERISWLKVKRMHIKARAL